jgi:hypothetical protein
MVFAYYNRLTAVQKRVYRKSDALHAVPLPRGQDLHPLISRLSASLQEEDGENIEMLCSEIAKGIAARLCLASVGNGLSGSLS